MSTSTGYLREEETAVLRYCLELVAQAYAIKMERRIIEAKCSVGQRIGMHILDSAIREAERDLHEYP
jgi:hypothetical protein